MPHRFHQDTRQDLMKAFVLFFWCFALASALGGETVIKDAEGMDCFVYTPDPLVPETTYQLVVGVHGANGKGNGAAGMQAWAKRGDVIVIGPSFSSKGERPYQNGDGIHAEKLIALFEGLKKEHKLHDKMFLHGFSGGSQFVHRFAMRHPKLVCGVSAHSGGTWATDGYGEFSTSAKDIPFAISCGEKDTGKAFPQAPFTRLEWFGRFRDEIEKKRFAHIAASWPDVGHNISPGAWDLAKQCFQLATGLPGESATQEVAISDAWKNIGHLKKAAPAPDPKVAELEKVLPAAFAKADAEEIPDDKLLTFMRKYPPTLWKDKPGSASLLKQCERAAKIWHAAAKANGLWKGAAKEEFLRYTQGLEIETEG
jgi:poly(3-hydroxybutyrate) depolymerase